MSEPKRFKYLGSCSHGTLRSQDLLPRFLDIARALQIEGLQEWETGLLENLMACSEEDLEETRCEALEELQDRLCNAAPWGLYFGSSEWDGTDFGFWVWDYIDHDAREQVREGLLNSGETLPDGPQSLPFFQINERGNMAYYEPNYKGELVEIWSCV